MYSASGTHWPVTAAVELVGRPPKDESPHNGEQERMADASVKAQVVELAQKVLAKHVQVWNGARHGTPNHRTVPDSASQHRFANGGTKHDLRQRIHGAKVGRHPWFLSTPGHNSWLFHMKHTPILSLCLRLVLSGLFPQDAQAQSESTTSCNREGSVFCSSDDERRDHGVLMGGHLLFSANLSREFKMIFSTSMGARGWRKALSLPMAVRVLMKVRLRRLSRTARATCSVVWTLPLARS